MLIPEGSRSVLEGWQEVHSQRHKKGGAGGAIAPGAMPKGAPFFKKGKGKTQELLPPSHAMEILGWIANKLESHERSFSQQTCSTAALPEPDTATVFLGLVVAQMEAEGTS